MAMVALMQLPTKATLADNRRVSNFSSLMALINHNGESIRILLLHRGHRPERKHRNCDLVSVVVHEICLRKWCLEQEDQVMASFRFPAFRYSDLYNIGPCCDRLLQCTLLFSLILYLVGTKRDINDKISEEVHTTAFL